MSTFVVVVYVCRLLLLLFMYEYFCCCLYVSIVSLSTCVFCTIIIVSMEGTIPETNCIQFIL